ncbi:MAG: DUF4134 domain-containing protein [Prolixibacteraceae bacterium]|nr:DUF4134 domain-containing protein [Prolixibacteraceae bacterium]
MKNKVIKSILCFCVFALFAEVVLADGLQSGISAATSQLKGYVDSIITLVMVIGGIVGIVGGIRIYTKWSHGDHDINKELMSWGGAAIFLVLVPIVIKAVFNL